MADKDGDDGFDLPSDELFFGGTQLSPRKKGVPSKDEDGLLWRAETETAVVSSTTPSSSHTVAPRPSHIEAADTSHTVAADSSASLAPGSLHADAPDSFHTVHPSSSHIVTTGSSHSVAPGSSHSVAPGSSHSVVPGSSHSVVPGSSHSVFPGSSHTMAPSSSHTMAPSSSHTMAPGSSQTAALLHTKGPESPGKNVHRVQELMDCGSPAPRPIAQVSRRLLVLGSPRPMDLGSLRPVACSSPRLIRKECDDGMVEEYRMNTPVIRRSKSLALRRVTSDLSSSSPQFKGRSPVPCKRRRFMSKASPLHRMKSEDRLSEASKESSSGPESESIETDEDAAHRLESLQSEEEDASKQKNKTSGCGEAPSSVLDDSVSAIVRIPFENMLMQQENEVADTIEGQTSEPQGEFKINRRWGRRKTEDAGCKGRLGRKSSDSTVLTELKENPVDQQIKSAVEILSAQRGDVISDGTLPYALPCFQGKKEELMFITGDTLVQLLDGVFEDAVDHYEVIDCRYPYEFEGGHIRGAVNMFQADSIEEIMSWKTEEADKRMVLIFHCEFSSQRGPSMMRLLRNTDRKHNSHCYPHLCHPEIYLLSGGYKAFYEKCPHLCEPQAYIPMSHRDFQNELRMFRSRASTWHGKDVWTKKSHSIIL